MLRTWSMRPPFNTEPVTGESLPRVAWRFKEGAAYGLVLLAAATLRLWGLDQNGVGNPYYAAGARSMVQSFSNFYFCAFDPGGTLSIDKPPISLWAQAFSAWCFGYHGWALALAQAVAGVLTIAVLMWGLQRNIGYRAALVAGVVLTLMPTSIAVDRSNLPDSWLVLAVTAAAVAFVEAVVRGSLVWVLASALCVGLGFNAKMAVAWGLLPTFAVVYAWAGPPGWRVRAGHLIAAVIAVVVTSFAWVLTVEATPAERRPFVGDTHDNSMLSLALGSNGMQRLGGGPLPSGGPLTKMPRPDKMTPPAGFELPPGAEVPPGFPPFGGRPGRGMMPGFSGPPGPLRMLVGETAEQYAWLLPIAVFGAWQTLRTVRGSQTVSGAQIFGLVSVGWLLTYGAVFSVSWMIHTYYASALAPPVAILVSLGVEEALSKRARWSVAALVAISATVGYQAWLAAKADALDGWMVIALGTIALAAGGALVPWPTSGRRWARLSTAVVGVGLAAIPTYWSLSSVLRPGNRMFPLADVQRFRASTAEQRPFGPPFEQDVTGLRDYLAAHRGEARFLGATSDIFTASNLIVATGDPVIALGGFLGHDPVLTLEQFVELIDRRQLRFVLLNGGGGPFGEQRREIADWCRAHGQLVPAAEWQGTADDALNSSDAPAARLFGPRRQELYDLWPRSVSAASLIPSPIEPSSLSR